MKSKQILSLTLLFIMISLISTGQDDNNWRLYKGKKEKVVKLSDAPTFDSTKKELNYNNPDGKVTVNQSWKIDSLDHQIAKKPFIYGYTIQIEVSQQTSIIKDSRYKFRKRYPDTPLDEKYNAPNTYLYAGRFYDKNSAYEFKNEIRKYFPNAIVIQNKMELPPLKKKEAPTENIPNDGNSQ